MSDLIRERNSCGAQKSEISHISTFTLPVLKRLIVSQYRCCRLTFKQACNLWEQAKKGNRHE